MRGSSGRFIVSLTKRRPFEDYLCEILLIKLFKLRCLHRFGKMVSLYFVAAIPGYKREYFLMFDPLRNGFKSEAFCHLDDRSDDDFIFLVFKDVPNERLIDFKFIDGKTL